mmetsp:Transcript_111449/g.228189  ORF Transcript_111449/g.228189 Transcript_111449/m.228189 type:complete len:236 (+) Transcript_111449:358-1065(+)|eukprot:CAMPEP_0201123778 /NCGR_PEP_ID=MMETSP0850-20130426/9087_1 /ASSEMBLY_ACC=CAM_ASM_000622 /TAXON_ID=183588 /ORGANISM="Pseudo-nitzschia fraudulenta, Strain WWA7" /LENGTH=235 /DNA_ID=CAMNT_0047390853 /DNA_START=45 /DNA_END=752 /DNA_ORIENTATION=-
MTPLATLSEHNMWTRFLNDTDDSNNGWPVKIYEWAMSLTILIVMLSVIWKKLQSAASDDQDADATDIETGDNNTDPERSPEEEAEFKKNFIFKLFQSEHIEEKITCENIRRKSCRTIDTLSTDDGKDYQSGDENELSDEEEGNGVVVVHSFPGDTEVSSDKESTEKSVSNLCAICLEEYHEGDTIVWSSNKQCRHAFHRECLTNYLVTVKDEETYPCPCCRQNFFFEIGSKSDKR